MNRYSRGEIPVGAKDKYIALKKADAVKTQPIYGGTEKRARS